MIDQMGKSIFAGFLVLVSSVSLADSDVCKLRNVETLSSLSCRIESLEVRGVSEVYLNADPQSCQIEVTAMIKTLDRTQCPPQPPNSPYDQCAQAAFDCASHDYTGHRCDHFYKFEAKSVTLDKSRVRILIDGSVITIGSCSLQVQ